MNLTNSYEEQANVELRFHLSYALYWYQRYIHNVYAIADFTAFERRLQSPPNAAMQWENPLELLGRLDQLRNYNSSVSSYECGRKSETILSWSLC